MLDEICARQFEMPDAVELNSEYSAKFGRKHFKDNQEQVRYIHKTHYISYHVSEHLKKKKSAPFSIKKTYSHLIDQKMANDNFKLYGKHSDGISFWNTAITNGRGHFKQYHPLTKLNIECLDEQWR